QQEPDMQFVWVGGTPFKRLGAASGELETLAGSVPTFTVTGVIPYEQVVDYFKAADVFLLPSEQETFGLVVIEAAAAGLPVVLRDIPDYQQTFASSAIMANEQDFLAHIRKLRSNKAY